MNKKHFYTLLFDKHRELLKRQQKLREEASSLGFDIRVFETMFKEARKDLPKEHSMWSLADEKCPFETLMNFKVMRKGKEVPFLSETYLYETVGKGDARTILSLIRSIYTAAGKPCDV
jgi:hypothetical protein